MWTDKHHKQWHMCRTGSGRCHVCLHGKACSSASFVAGCGVVYPRLVPPSLGIYLWVLHIVIGCSSLWKRSYLVKTNSGWNRQLMPTRNSRRPEKGYRWILEGSTLQNQWLMRIVTLGFWPNTIGDICCSKIYSFRICLLGHQHSHTRSELVKYVSQHLNPYCNGRLFCWWLHSFATFFKKASLIIWVHDGSWRCLPRFDLFASSGWWLEDWNLTLWAAEISQHFSTGRFKQVHCSAMTGSAAKCPGAPFYTYNAWELYEPK